MQHATPSNGARATGASLRGGAHAKAVKNDTPARPVSCSICVRSDVSGINEALIAGRSSSSVAISFCGSRTRKDAVSRHATKCLRLGDAITATKRRKAGSRRLERALNAVRVERVTLTSAAAILEQHERRYVMASEIVEEARVARDNRMAIAADEVRGKILNDAARLQGFEKSASPLVNFRFEVVRAKVAALSDDQIDRLIAGEAIPELIEGELVDNRPAVLA